MAVNYANHDTFKIDTDAINDAMTEVKGFIDSIETLKQEVDDVKADLITDWVGQGRNEFEKTYAVVSRKFTDHIDCAWDLYEEMMTAYETYVQADVELSKTEEGVTTY